MKKAVPVLKGIPDDQIRISYKDVQLGSFVNIDSHEQLHLQETFRNAFPCGSDSYRRVHLKVRESDSPFLLKSSRSSQPLPQETEHTKPSVAKSKLEPKTLFTPSDDCHESELASTFNWKDSKKEQLIWQQQSLCDKKLAIETHLRELELQVVEPPRDGNKKNDKCNAPPCTSYFMCGQKKKHSEHFEEIKKRKRELKEVTREIEKVSMEKKNLEAFQSKSISAFATAVTQRLLKAFPEKYSPRTPGEKLALQKDIATLRIACNNKIPSVADDERNMFLELLEKQRQLSALEMNPVSVQIHSSNCNESSASTSMSKVHSEVVTVNQFAISPVRSTVRQKQRRSRSSSSESSSEDSSDSSTDRERKHRKKKRRKLAKKKKYRHKKKRRKSTYSCSSRDGKAGAPVHGSSLCRSSKELSQGDITGGNCSLTELASIAVAMDESCKTY